jgi:hypothetical protein
VMKEEKREGSFGLFLGRSFQRHLGSCDAERRKMKARKMPSRLFLGIWGKERVINNENLQKLERNHGELITIRLHIAASWTLVAESQGQPLARVRRRVLPPRFAPARARPSEMGPVSREARVVDMSRSLLSTLWSHNSQSWPTQWPTSRQTLCTCS